ncbi:MAG: hypothetical protein ACRD3F_14095 [Acidobacteriaceae bacterium]
MTEVEQSRASWKGELGRIDRALLDKYLGGVCSPIYYISGQPDLVDELHDMLREARVEDEDIRIEEFAGY